MLAYLARYTHRVAISNSRLIALDDKGVTFKWKDYRIKGRDRLKTMTLDAAEFIRRFLLHVLPSGFHRIRHYGLIAGAVRAHNIERVRQLLTAATQPRESERAEADNETETPPTARRCPCCGGRMIIIDTFEGARPAQSPSPPGSESTPHDRRRASRLATSIAFPSSRAPEHKSADLVTSEDPLRPLRQRQTRTCSRPKRLVFVAGPVTTARRRAARRRMRSAGDLEIPIGRAPPNSALPPRGFLLARLSNAGPRRLAQPSCKGPASETLQPSGHRPVRQGRSASD